MTISNLIALDAIKIQYQEGITLSHCIFCVCQIARDVDGSGNYFMLSNKHVAQLHRLSAYGAKVHKLGLPEWVLFHEFTLSNSNCIRTVTQISPKV